MTSDIEKFKQRREKFGNHSQIEGVSNNISGSSLGLTDKDKEIKNKRRERFGVKGNDDKLGKIEFNSDVINKRKERFGEISENDKRTIRKEGKQVRFGLRKGRRRGFSFKNGDRLRSRIELRRGDEKKVTKRREFNRRIDFSNRRAINRRRY